jgi:hypothetical protein
MPPKRKATGLAAFTQQQAPVEQPHETTIRTKAKGDTIAITVRLSHDQWHRLHELARLEGISLNQLALQGFSELFKRKGLPEL